MTFEKMQEYRIFTGSLLFTLQILCFIVMELLFNPNSNSASNCSTEANTSKESGGKNKTTKTTSPATDVSPHHLFIQFACPSSCVFLFVHCFFSCSFSSAFYWPSLLSLASLVQMQSCCYPALLLYILLPEGLCV